MGFWRLVRLVPETRPSSVFRSRKMLLKPLVLQHLRKEKLLRQLNGDAGDHRLAATATFFIFVRECQDFLGFSNIFRQRRGAESRRRFRSPYCPPEPLSASSVWGTKVQRRRAEGMVTEQAEGTAVLQWWQGCKAERRPISHILPWTSTVPE